MEKDTSTLEWKNECLERHQSEISKLNSMTYKEAANYCAKIKATNGEIAAKELWKSSKHWRQDGKNRDSKR